MRAVKQFIYIVRPRTDESLFASKVHYLLSLVPRLCQMNAVTVQLSPAWP